MNISIEDSRWKTLDFDEVALRAVTSTLAARDVPNAISEISILACDDPQITTLNAEFRTKPTPTNVLSWPAQERAAARDGGTPEPPQTGPDGLIALGDIAISYDTCAREALAAGKPLADHLTHLIVHATLHLLGYDHESDMDGALMEGLEVKILGKLGLDDPYRNS